jgi:hypothetical protein
VPLDVVDESAVALAAGAVSRLLEVPEGMQRVKRRPGFRFDAKAARLDRLEAAARASAVDLAGLAGSLERDRCARVLAKAEEAEA